jgi:hypothetical protein
MDFNRTPRKELKLQMRGKDPTVTNRWLIQVVMMLEVGSVQLP